MASDLFGTWLPSLWNKTQPEGSPPVFMMHRFMASDKTLAMVARYFQQEIREPDLIFHTWQAFLPRARGAPRMQYVAPKKQRREEELEARIMEVEKYRRELAEEAVILIRMAGAEREACAHYGVEYEDEDEDDSPPEPEAPAGFKEGLI